MGSIAHLNELDLRLQSEFPTLVHENEQLFEASDGHLALDWGILFFMAIVFSCISLCIVRGVSKDGR